MIFPFLTIFELFAWLWDPLAPKPVGPVPKADHQIKPTYIGYNISKMPMPRSIFWPPLGPLSVTQASHQKGTTYRHYIQWGSKQQIFDPNVRQVPDVAQRPTAAQNVRNEMLYKKINVRARFSAMTASTDG